MTAAGADDLVFSLAGEPVLRDGAQARRQQCHFDVARAVLAELGWCSAPAKEQPPSESIAALGVTVDSASGRVTLSEGKRVRYSALAAQVQQLAVCSEGMFRELLGRLQFATLCYPLGQQAMHAMWRAMRTHYRLRSGGVVVSAAIRRDLQWWVDALRDEEHEGGGDDRQQQRRDDFVREANLEVEVAAERRRREYLEGERREDVEEVLEVVGPRD